MNRARTKNTNLRRILAVLLLMLTPLALRDRQALAPKPQTSSFFSFFSQRNIGRSVVVR